MEKIETQPGNAMVSKVTVKIKTDDTTIKEEFLIYDAYTSSHEDTILNELVSITASKYKGDLSLADITITTKLTWMKNVGRST